MKSARLNRRSKRGKHGGGWMAGHLHGGGSAGRETGRTENRITTPSRRSVVGLDAGSEAGRDATLFRHTGLPQDLGLAGWREASARRCFSLSQKPGVAVGWETRGELTC
jgi:hypothetical protein